MGHLVLLKIVYWFGRLEANAGALTNYEVVDFLRSKGAANDSTRVLAQVSPSEYKVLFILFLCGLRLTPLHFFTKGWDFIYRCMIIWSRLLLAIKPESISMSSSTSVKSMALQRLRSLISSTLGLLLSLIFIR